MAAAACCWAIVETLGRLVPGHVPPLQVVWTRYGVHLATLCLWCGANGVPFYRTKRIGVQFLRSSMMLVMPLSFVAAARQWPQETIWSSFWIAPAAFLLIAHWAFREATDLWSIAGAVLGWLGVIVALHPPIAIAPRGLAPVGAMTTSFVVYLLLTRFLAKESLASKLFYTAFGVFAALTPGVVRSWKTPSPDAAAAMVAIGLAGLALLYFLDRALDAMHSSEAASLLLLAPLAAAAFDAALGTEALGGSRITGAALILAGIAAGNRVRRA